MLEDDPLPLLEVPTLEPAGQRRWRTALDRRMSGAGLESAACVESRGDFEIGGFKDAFSRLRQGRLAELRLWFVEHDGKRARVLARAFRISPAALVDDLYFAAEPPAAPWHVVFPGVELDAVYVDPPLGPETLRPGAAPRRRSASLWSRDETPPVTPPTPTFEEQIVAWYEAGSDRTSDARSSRIGWLVGESGSGRRTLARRMAAIVDAQVMSEPPPCWTTWRETAQGRWIACVTPATFDADIRQGCRDPHWPMVPWTPAQLRALVERLLACPRGIDERTAQAARTLCDRWARSPGLAAPVASPDALISILGALAANPETELASPGALIEATWSTLQARGGEALAAYGPALLVEFWTTRWLDPDAKVWWRMTPAEFRAALDTCGAAPSGASAIAALLDDLERGRGKRGPKIDQIRRALEACGPTALAEVLTTAGELCPSDDGQVEAADPRRALLWVARGLSRRGALDFSSLWHRLADRYWPDLAGALVAETVKPISLHGALEKAPPHYAVDRARGMVHAFDASAEDDLSRRARQALVRAFFDAAWAQLLGLSHPVAYIGHIRRGLPPSDFARTSLVVERLSRRFAGVLPDLDGPHFAEALRARVSPAVHRIAAAVGRPAPYTLWFDDPHVPLRSVVDPEREIHIPWPKPEVAELRQGIDDCTLDVRVALFIASQCPATRPEQLPGFAVPGVIPASADGFTPHGPLPLCMVVIEEWLRCAPPAWWCAIERRARDGDGDAVDVLNGMREFDRVRPTPKVGSSGQVIVLGFDTPLPDPLPNYFSPGTWTVDGREVAVAIAHTPMILRVADPESFADGREHWERHCIEESAPGESPTVLRALTRAEWADTLWYQCVPRTIRRRWLGRAASHSAFMGRWYELASPEAGVFEVMIADMTMEARGSIYDLALEPPSPERGPFEVRYPTVGGAPPLWSLLALASQQGDFDTLRRLERLARRWVEDVSLGGRPGAWAVAFDGWPSTPTTRRSRGKHWADDHAVCRARRTASDGARLLSGLMMLDEVGHAAAVALHRLGRPEPLQTRWRSPALEPTDDWRRRRAFIERLDRLWGVELRALEAASDTLPLDVAVDWTWSLVHRWAGQGSSRRWDPLSKFAEALRGRFGSGAGRDTEPGWPRQFRWALGELEPSFRPLPDPPPPQWPRFLHALRERPEPDKPNEGDRLMVAAILTGVLAVHGLPPLGSLPPAEVSRWLDTLASADSPRHGEAITPDQALQRNADRRSSLAGLALLDAGDEGPLRAFCGAETITPIDDWIHRRLLDDHTALDRWLPHMAPRGYTVLGGGEASLFVAGLDHRLEGAHRLWMAWPREQRVYATIAHRAHPFAARWARRLYDEALVGGEWALGRLSALLLQRHAPSEPRVTDAIRRWMLDDPEPFDLRQFWWVDEHIEGGAEGMVTVVDRWLETTVRLPGWFAAGVRRIFAKAPRSGPADTGYMRLTHDPRRTSDVGRRWPAEIEYGHVQLDDSVWRWLRRAGCRDLRDARMGAGGGVSLEHPTVAWWLDEASDTALWQRIDATVEAYLHPDADRGTIRLANGRLAGACMERLMDRAPDTVLDWCRRACAEWPSTDPGPFDDERPLWAWHEFGIEVVVACMGSRAPGELPAVWHDWFEQARTPGQRQWVLLHVGDRATGPARPDTGLAAETLRTLLMRSPNTASDGGQT